MHRGGALAAGPSYSDGCVQDLVRTLPPICTVLSLRQPTFNERNSFGCIGNVVIGLSRTGAKRNQQGIVKKMGIF